jgi:mannosyltransferase
MDNLYPTSAVSGYYEVKSLSPDDSRESGTSLATVFLLVFLMLAVSALSFLFLSRQSLRLDEAQSIWQSSHSTFGVINVISQDVHVPLYGLLLHFWQLFFGTDVAVGRTLSLIFFLLSIPAIYALGAEAYNQNVGRFAALILAASPFLNWYGNEMRMYSLLLLLAIVNQYFFIRLFSGRRSLNSRESEIYSWWGFGISAFLGIYTHYFFWLLLLTEGVYFAFNRKKFPGDALRNFSIIALLLLLAIAPWLWYVKSQHQIANQAPGLLKPTSVDFFNVFSQFMFGFQDDHVNTTIVSLWPLAVLLSFLGLRKNKDNNGPSAFFVLAACLPVLVALAVSLWVRPVFLARYLILAVPALYLFLAWFISGCSRRLSLLLKSLLLGVMLLTLYQQMASANTPTKENYHQATDYLSLHAAGGDIIVLSAPFTIYPVEYYYSGPAAIATLPLWNFYQTGPIPSFSEQQLPGQVAGLIKNHQNVWLLLSYDQGYQNKIFLYFETHFQRLDHQNFSPHLDLYEYKINYTAR